MHPTPRNPMAEMRRTRGVTLSTPSPLEFRLPRASKPARASKSAQHTWHAPLMGCAAAAAAAAVVVVVVVVVVVDAAAAAAADAVAAITVR